METPQVHVQGQNQRVYSLRSWLTVYAASILSIGKTVLQGKTAKFIPVTMTNGTQIVINVAKDLDLPAGTPVKELLTNSVTEGANEAGEPRIYLGKVAKSGGAGQVSVDELLK